MFSRSILKPYSVNPAFEIFFNYIVLIRFFCPISHDFKIYQAFEKFACLDGHRNEHDAIVAHVVVAYVDVF